MYFDIKRHMFSIHVGLFRRLLKLIYPSEKSVIIMTTFYLI